MAITLDGTSGITTPAVTNNGAYTGDGISFADGTPSNTLVTTTGGNVGIGTNTPDAKFKVVASGANLLVGYGGTANYYDASTHTFRNFAGTNYGMFDSSGNLLVGSTTSSTVSRNVSAFGSNYWQYGASTTGSSNFWVLNSSNTGVALVSGNTSWSAQSDERTKDIIEPITDAANKVSTLRAVIGKYKTDENGIRRPFLIAQDVQAVLPEAIDDMGDEQGTLGLRYTDTIPLLVAAIQELKAELDTVKTELATLKGTA